MTFLNVEDHHYCIFILKLTFDGCQNMLIISYSIDTKWNRVCKASQSPGSWLPKTQLWINFSQRKLSFTYKNSTFAKQFCSVGTNKPEGGFLVRIVWESVIQWWMYHLLQSSSELRVKSPHYEGMYESFPRANRHNPGFALFSLTNCLKMYELLLGAIHRNKHMKLIQRPIFVLYEKETDFLPPILCIKTQAS